MNTLVQCAPPLTFHAGTFHEGLYIGMRDCIGLEQSVRTRNLGWMYTNLARSNWYGRSHSPAAQHHCMPLVNACMQVTPFSSYVQTCTAACVHMCSCLMAHARLQCSLPNAAAHGGVRSWCSITTSASTRSRGGFQVQRPRHTVNILLKYEVAVASRKPPNVPGTMPSQLSTAVSVWSLKIICSSPISRPQQGWQSSPANFP